MITIASSGKPFVPIQPRLINVFNNYHYCQQDEHPVQQTNTLSSLSCLSSRNLLFIPAYVRIMGCVFRDGRCASIQDRA